MDKQKSTKVDIAYLTEECIPPCIMQKTLSVSSDDMDFSSILTISGYIFL